MDAANHASDFSVPTLLGIRIFWFSTASWFQNLLITKIYKNILASIFMFEKYSTSITEIL